MKNKAMAKLEKERLQYLLFMVGILFSLSLTGCKHEPIEPLTNNNDGDGNGGGGGGTGIPCDTNVVYFDQQILPLLTTYCTRVNGCHSASAAEEGIILDSYANVTSTAVDTSDPFDSDFWEKINETNPGDPNDIMPPLGEPQMSQEQIALINLWLAQGAQNLHCDEGLSGCDSTNTTFTGSVQPIMQNKCIGCHSTANSGNGFVSLAGYSGVAAVAATGQLVGSITHAGNYTAMPLGGPQISACDIAKIRSWVNNGYPNN
jgi:uncharacterized membrane protein